MATMYEQLYNKLRGGEVIEVSGVSIATLRPKLSSVHAAVRRSAEEAGFKLPDRRIEIRQTVNAAGEPVMHVQLVEGASNRSKVKWAVVDAEGSSDGSK